MPKSENTGSDANTKLLIHADGSGQTFIDSSPAAHTLTVGGNATQSTTQSKFGGSSAYFDGTGDYISIASPTDFNFGTGDFTIEWWGYNFNSLAATHAIFSAGDASSGGFAVLANTNYIYIQNNGDSIETDCGNAATSGWNHFAVVRYQGTMYWFINGLSQTLTGTGNFGTYNITYTGTSTIGTLNNGTTNPMLGYIDEIRVSNVARWHDNFMSSVPSSAYASGNYIDNMTLVSNSTTALTAPTQGRFMVLQEQPNPTTVVNTDWKAYITSDNGTHWDQVTLATEGSYSDNVTMYSGTATYTGTGTGMRWKLQTFNKNNIFRGIDHVWN
ncbi:MAG: LamG domain-containing protein [Nitrospirae bacterium]|nr:LamG domain-containing protein [Nitrospirota bacterium]